MKPATCGLMLNADTVRSVIPIDDACNWNSTTYTIFYKPSTHRVQSFGLAFNGKNINGSLKKFYTAFRMRSWCSLTRNVSPPTPFCVQCIKWRGRIGYSITTKLVHTNLYWFIITCSYTRRGVTRDIERVLDRQCQSGFFAKKRKSSCYIFYVHSTL